MSTDNKELDKQDDRGDSFETAIVIQAENTDDGIRQEYAWVHLHYGKRDVDWQFEGQALSFHDDRPYDILRLILADGTKKDIYFDISSFFGKF
jgi:hypothetical protein